MGISVNEAIDIGKLFGGAVSEFRRGYQEEKNRQLKEAMTLGEVIAKSYDIGGQPGVSLLRSTARALGRDPDKDADIAANIKALIKMDTESRKQLAEYFRQTGLSGDAQSVAELFVNPHAAMTKIAASEVESKLKTGQQAQEPFTLGPGQRRFVPGVEGLAEEIASGGTAGITPYQQEQIRLKELGLGLQAESAKTGIEFLDIQRQNLKLRERGLKQSADQAVISQKIQSNKYVMEYNKKIRDINVFDSSLSKFLTYLRSHGEELKIGPVNATETLELKNLYADVMAGVQSIRNMGVLQPGEFPFLEKNVADPTEWRNIGQVGGIIRQASNLRSKLRRQRVEEFKTFRSVISKDSTGVVEPAQNIIELNGKKYEITGIRPDGDFDLKPIESTQ